MRRSAGVGAAAARTLAGDRGGLASPAYGYYLGMVSRSRLTPPLPTAKADYLRHGISRIKGWLNPSTAVYLSALEVLQRRGGPAGDVCEIGIHHGLSFLCLALGMPSGQRAVAIDVFGDEGNVDLSGQGDRRIFERNLARHGAHRSAIDIIQASSLDLDALGFTAQGRRLRFISIDGGHTAEITQNDLRVAERTLVEGGLVALDDVLNPSWLGVVTGLFRYWSEGGTLVPAVMVPGKLILGSSVEAAAMCRQWMDENFGLAVDKRSVQLGSGEVDVYGERRWIVVDERGAAGRLANARRMRAPLGRRLATRMPRLARPVRPLVHRIRARRSA